MRLRLRRRLAQRLRALAAIRKAGEYLIGRPRLGRDFFARGEPEPPEASGRTSYHGNLYDLLAAYARQTQRHALARVRFKTREVWSLAEAREALARLVGVQSDWTALDEFLIEACTDSQMRRSARASTFAASLELAREGKIELRQERSFAPIWLRSTGLDPGEERAA